jgi:tRNA dimethylallyltransferase
VTPLLLILGATASGKSTLAIQAAQALGGEVVSADALAVYRGLDIGTAKPTPAERALVPHHLIDVLDPHERCDAARWLGLAEAAIAGIRSRGRLPIIAGGTPLYVKLLLEGISAGPPRDPALRERLHATDPTALWAELTRVDPTYAAGRHPNDLRRIVRALEVWHLTGRPYSSFHTTDGRRRPDLAPVLIGLDWDRTVLHRRIGQRVQRMLDAGLVDEVRRLRGRLSPEAAQAVGYKELLAWLDGHITYDQAVADIATGTRHLAKHQLTWYRRFPDLIWLPGDAPDLLDRVRDLAPRMP